MIDTLTAPKKELSRQEQFAILLKRLTKAGYKLDTEETARLQRLFMRGNFGEIIEEEVNNGATPCNDGL